MLVELSALPFSLGDSMTMFLTGLNDKLDTENDQDLVDQVGALTALQENTGGSMTVITTVPATCQLCAVRILLSSSSSNIFKTLEFIFAI